MVAVGCESQARRRVLDVERCDEDAAVYDDEDDEDEG